jgi:hypothetical protein
MVTGTRSSRASSRCGSSGGEPIVKVPAGATTISGQSWQSLNLSPEPGRKQRCPSAARDNQMPSHCWAVLKPIEVSPNMQTMLVRSNAFVTGASIRLTYLAEPSQHSNGLQVPHRVAIRQDNCVTSLAPIGLPRRTQTAPDAGSPPPSRGISVRLSISPPVYLYSAGEGGIGAPRRHPRGPGCFATHPERRARKRDRRAR